LGIENLMTETEHKNVRVNFWSLVPVFFVIGAGCGVVLIPLGFNNFFSQGFWLGLGLVAITPIINGIFAVVMLFAGYPAYYLLSRKRLGYSVRLIDAKAEATKVAGGAN